MKRGSPQDYMRRAPMVEPPAELIGDIIHQTTGIGGECSRPWRAEVPRRLCRFGAGCVPSFIR